MKGMATTLAASALVLLSLPASAQQDKYETPNALGVAGPDKIETSLGTLNLTYGEIEPPG